MELYQILISQTGLGVIAGVFAYLYFSEKKEHKETRQEVRDLQESRRLDAVETRTAVTSILPGISQSLQNISDKIEISKDSRRR